LQHPGTVTLRMLGSFLKSFWQSW